MSEMEKAAKRHAWPHTNLASAHETGFERGVIWALDEVLKAIEATKEGDPEDGVCLTAREIMRHELLAAIEEMRQ